MKTTVVFKGGPMDGTEITYENTTFLPQEGEVIFVSNGRAYNHPFVSPQVPSAYWMDFVRKVYVYVESLRSWVYDHEYEVTDEE